MPRGNPGQRRGQRGANDSKKRPAKSRSAKAEPAASKDRDDARAKVLASAMEDCRVKNPGARTILGAQLERHLRLAEVLDDRLRDGTITSEEASGMNANQRNIMKLIQAMGLDELRDHDDCPACNGSGAQGPDACSVCDGSGVR